MLIFDRLDAYFNKRLRRVINWFERWDPATKLIVLISLMIVLWFLAVAGVAYTFNKGL